MAITLPHSLPARALLAREKVPLNRNRSQRQGETPPLRILLLNLMPEKPATEVQIGRILGWSDIAVELTLAIPDGHSPKTTAPEHIERFYSPWTALRNEHFDGLIVTGAPVETLRFEEVSYWHELTRILEWAATEVSHSYLICWAAQAALYHFHGVPKHVLSEKVFGVFPHQVLETNSDLFQGIEERFLVPASRHAETRLEDLPDDGYLSVLAASEESGLCLLDEAERGFTYMFNHLEYSADTLALEYRRDLSLGRPITRPKNYFPSDDPTLEPANTWQAAGRRVYHNWLTRIVARKNATAARQPEGSLEFVP